MSIWRTGPFTLLLMGLLALTLGADAKGTPAARDVFVPVQVENEPSASAPGGQNEIHVVSDSPLHFTT